jgi:hypothetical protein
VYLLGTDPGLFDWERRWVKCPDFRTPRSTDDAIAACREAFDRAVTERVEVGCGGGLGRTGLALSLIAIISGITPGGAVEWVRANYNPRAVETPWQRRWVANLRIDEL